MDRVDIQGIPISYETRGEGTPILLIHGWSADHRYMVADLEPVFETRPGWRRTYLDLPGHGQTPAPDWLATQAQMLSILHGFVEAAMGDGPFAVAGNSYGGYLTLGLVRTIPERLRGVALLVPDVPGADGTRDLPDPVTLFPDPSIFTDLEPDEEWIPQALVVHDPGMLAEIRAHDMPAYRSCDGAFLERLERNYVFEGADAEPGPGFEGPSLILTGRQDARVGYRGAWSLIDEFPRATYGTADLAGHHLGRIERPELFCATVADWLDRVAMGNP